MAFKLSIFLLIFVVSTNTFAEFVGSGVASNLATVKSVKGMKDDTKVTLEGYIVKEIRSEHYLFKDATGEIEVEIDSEDFRSVKVTSNDKVRIVGEVDKERTLTMIDVDYIELVK